MNKNLHKNTKDELIEEILKLRDELETKDKKIKELEWKLNLNSTNSSKPSSTQWFRKHTKICNSRIKWKNPRWWVKWHKWWNLERNKKVDETIDVSNKICSNCWANLLDDFVKIVNKSVRQVIDIVSPSSKIIDYIWKDKKCGRCWFLNKAIFPKWITKPVQYWPNIKSFSIYMYNHQMPSYERLQEFFKEAFWINISQTTLMNFNKIWYENLGSFEKNIKESLIEKELLHADETWIRVDWNTSRIHVNSNNNLTYYYSHKKRWREGVEEMWVLNKFKWNCITDHYQSYLAYIFIHYFCNAHHLRELTWVIENENKKWAVQLTNILIKSKKLREEMILKWINFIEKNILKDIHIEYKNILQNWKIEYEIVVRKPWQRWKIKKEKWLNLLERLEKNEDWTLGFLHDFNIPFDNNLAERDLRMIKTKTKISGCFRSTEWAEWFCRIRSYISTMRKQKQDIYKSINSIFDWELLLPEF